MIRDAEQADSQQICDIYNHYIRHSSATFEEVELDVAQIAARISQLQQHYVWLVFERDEKILGYAYAGQWKPRSAYRFAAECSIYLAKDAAGKGVGKALYSQLIDLLEDYPIATLIGGIALPNPASIALHERLGFHKVAEFERIGRKFGRWVNVGYWQRQIKTEQQIEALEQRVAEES
ncbi:N-acetyltransferase family protein [Agarivorans sp. MS3-6]|uniref:GNAT family N-acetyltransferase n=1 Tax=Agarivorans sp. TSD2052 TaxID=2937286 RepID=UPI0020104BC8|nr:GNAT family N-acetyltransferase [Agarivorans sp. TSD2052]UPW18831.1 N-acetyltransferase family protein [Agarivorans sp. TSD2052]